MLRRLYSTILERPSVTTSEMSPIKNSSLSGTFGVKHLESLDWLHSMGPCFRVRAEQIEILTEPQAFYEKLLTLCTNARHRISLASLYIGTGRLESELVTEIQKNVQRNANLKVNILIDYTRGTRGKSDDVTSKGLLQKLVDESKNVFVSLYHTPNLRGLTKRVIPARWNELVGLQHMKIYVADHTVIISGANLSNDYFTNRQDRYIVINDKNLSDFYFQLIEKVQEFSLLVSQDAKCCLHPKWNVLPYKRAHHKDFVALAHESICSFYAKTIDDLPDATMDDDKKMDTWIFPLIEMGQLDIHHDSVVTQKLFCDALPDSRLNLTTGYFNLTQSYMKTLATTCKAKCDILMAHPNANGFQGASGPAGGIPAAYSQIAKTFYHRLVKLAQVQRIKLFEYERTGWTYHAKGLWYYLPESFTPDLTLIGSSNFGERSVNRDLESQICLVTVNNELRRQLQREYVNLRRYCSPAEEALRTRSIPKWVRTVVVYFRNYF